MKQQYFYLLSLFILSICMISCGDDDGGGSTDSTQLRGLWQGQSFEAEQSFDVRIDGESFVGATSTMSGENIDICFEMTVDSFYTTGSYDMVYSVMSDGEEDVNGRETQDPVDDKGTYEVKGDTLDITSSFFVIVDPQTGQVTEEEVPATFSIRGDELTVTQEFERESVNQEGVVVTVKSKAVAKYRRK